MSFNALYSRYRSELGLRKAASVTARASARESEFISMSDATLAAEFQQLKDVAPAEALPGALAICREVARRVTGKRLYDVQINAAAVLLNQQVAEMRTGEGKTLSVFPAAAIQALLGLPVHVITANPYLAERDAKQLAPLYAALGLSCGFIVQGQPKDVKKAAYAASVCYGTASEFGFDFLRDNTALSADEAVQRGLGVAIVDELDSILLDEARTPLVLSRPSNKAATELGKIWSVVSRLQPGHHFELYSEKNQCSFTEAGWGQLEDALASEFHLDGGLYADGSAWLARRAYSALRARLLYRLNKDYVVRDGEVVLVDANTGRLSVGKRLGDHLHEFLELKEGLAPRPPAENLASITYQSYFKQYPKLAGLTGTAFTDAEELRTVYGLETVCIPTNKPSKLSAAEDVVCDSRAAKLAQAAELVVHNHQLGRPVLVGAGSVREADELSALLHQRGVTHRVLSAKHHADEALVVAQAGAPGAVTVATHMAGRGTDILLGGPDESKRAEVVDRGGLLVLGLGRNESRRVDLQLAGRAGRQGDPGEVQFLISPEDELFAQNELLASRLAAALRLGPRQVAKLVLGAQMRCEAVASEARQQLLRHVEAQDAQRDAYYRLRAEVLAHGGTAAKGLATYAALAWFDAILEDELSMKHSPMELKRIAREQLGIEAPFLRWLEVEDLTLAECRKEWALLVESHIAQHVEGCGTTSLLLEFDNEWAHLQEAMADLQDAVALGGHAGVNPLYAYKRRSVTLFDVFLQQLGLLVLRCGTRDEKGAEPTQSPLQKELASRWVTRNEACPCGSALKFKHCHGRLV